MLGYSCSLPEPCFFAMYLFITYFAALLCGQFVKRATPIFQQSYRLYRHYRFPAGKRAGTFVFDDNIFDFGYATLDRFFQLAPWILLLLIPAITMRSFAEEFKTGTYEILQTRPLSRWQIISGKYLGSLIVVIIALLPTIIYIFPFNGFLLLKGWIWEPRSALISGCFFGCSFYRYQYLLQQFYQ